MTKDNLTIAIDARPFVGGYSGYTTYLISIIEPLLDNGFKVTLLANKPLSPAHSIADRCEVVVFGSLHSSVWEQINVPNYLRHHHVDIYFVGTNKGLPWRKTKGTRYILGLLDIIPYKFPSYYLTKLHFIIRELRPVAQLISVIRADELITISEQSAHDIQHFFHRSAKSLLLRLKSGSLATKPAVPLPQFSYVGGVDRRKKIDVLLRAFALFHHDHPEYKLILIGRGYEVFNNLATELDIKNAVIMTGFIDDAAKMKAIAESTALVYPSLYEGYGLAIAEGFIANVPVIAGTGGSQKEIGGDAVLYINPTDQKDIAQAMQQALNLDIRQRLNAARERQLPKLFGSQIETAIVAYFTEQANRVKE